MKRMYLLTLRFILGLVVLSFVVVGAAQAKPCQDRACGIKQTTYFKVKAVAPEQRISGFIQKNNLPSFSLRGIPVFAMPKGLFSSNQSYSYSSSPKYSKGEKEYLTQLSPNIVEFAVSSHHLNTRVGDGNYDNISSLTAGKWRGPSYSGDRLGVLVHLSDSEMGRLRNWIDRAVKDHDGTLGTFEFNGGDPRTPAPNKKSNCTSWVTCAPIGDHGETLGQLTGLGNYAEPYSWVKGLANYGNTRIKGIVVHAPDETKPFNQTYLNGLFEKYTYRH
jgi:hypothetical protein